LSQAVGPSGARKNGAARWIAFANRLTFVWWRTSPIVDSGLLGKSVEMVVVVVAVLQLAKRHGVQAVFEWRLSADQKDADP